MSGRLLDTPPEIDAVLARMRTVAVVGLSPSSRRPSHLVTREVQRAGVRILPVNPCGGTILGETVYSRLEAVPDRNRVDVIDVFRRPGALPGLVEEVLLVYPAAEKPVLWFQLGVTHPRAEARALAAGFDLVVDRCLIVEHRRWKRSRGGLV